MTKIKGLLPVLIMLILVSVAIPATLAAVTTDGVSLNTSTFCVIFQGTASGNTTIAWFEYGINQSQNEFSTGGAKSFKTPNQTVSGTYNKSICGLPFISGKDYVVQAGGVDGTTAVYGSNVSFTFPTVQPHVTTTYEQYVNAFIDDAASDPVKLVTVDIWLVYTMTIGSVLFFSIVIGMSFMNMVTKQRTVAMAVLVVFLTGTSIWALFPPEFVQFAEILMLLAVGGLFYWLAIRRR
jgi:hypothetical protein